MRIKILFIGLALSLALLSCSLVNRIPGRQPTATPSPSPTATRTPTPTATPTPTPTPTPVPAVRIEQGDRALMNGDWDAAMEQYQSARQFGSDDAIQSAAAFGLGRTQFASGQAAQAVETLRTLIANYPASEEAPYAYFYLGQAYEAVEQYSEAADAYLNYMALKPGLVEGYVLEIRGDALFAAGDYSQAALDYQSALSAPSLSDQTLIQMKMARAYALGGDTETALRLYDQIASSTSNEYTQALILLRKGQIYTNLGDMQQAYEVYLQAVNNYPTSYDSYSALLTLVEAGVPVDELQRGLVDYFAGEYGVAMAAFDRYLQGTPADPGTALYYYGLSQRALGGYQGAVVEWDKLINNYPEHRYWDEAWEEKAFTQWYYLDQYTLAINTLLEFVETVPTHPRAGEFLFDAAWVAERFERLDQAVELYERLALEYPSDPQVQRALFLAGIDRYRLGDYAGAQQSFQRALGQALSLSERAAATLWIGKTQQAQGDNAGALATWEQAASVDPTGYYSERALDLLNGRKPFDPPGEYDLVVDWQAERAKADEWMRQRFLLSEEENLSGPGILADNPGFMRGEELWKLGLYEQARNEFEAMRTEVESDPVLSYRLTNYLFDLGLYRSAIFAARQVLDLAGMDDASSLAAPPYFNHIRFGTYYSDLVLPIAQEYAFHPLFVFSLIRQESLFESFIRSSAAASGLMQIIPGTGEEIARNLGWPPAYNTSDLNRPLVNLTFGMDYLDAQRRAFKGNMYAALAAYNGGPGRAVDWQRLAGEDPDLFIEVVHLQETRDYIRRIYENYNIYRRIYDRTP